MAEIGKQNAEGIGKALQYFREITAKAPDFALGLAGHASVLFSLGWWGHAPAREVHPTAKQMPLFPGQSAAARPRGAACRPRRR